MYICVLFRVPRSLGILEKSMDLENTVPGPGKVQEFVNY